MDTTIQNFIPEPVQFPLLIQTCVTAKSADIGTVVGIENCVYPNVGDPVLQITFLISPARPDPISSRNAIFTWAGGILSVGSSYKLKIVQIIGNSVPQVVQSNQTERSFEKDGLRISLASVSTIRPNFYIGKNMLGETSGTSNSEIFSFKVKRDRVLLLYQLIQREIITDTEEIQFCRT
ncbi:MAG: hypothetical protein IPG78_03790 [Ignavibacteria bacterium]|nr:hypothetical protein [Ignavibacteria bacterium]